MPQAHIDRLKQLLQQTLDAEVFSDLKEAEFEWLVSKGWDTAAALKAAKPEQLSKGVAEGRAAAICSAFAGPGDAGGGAAPTTIDILEYQVTPLDFATMKFEAKLPQPVNMLRVDATRCNLLSVPVALRGVVSIGDKCDKLSSSVMSLLSNRKMGTSKDSLHSRDDAILQIIEDVSGMRAERNKQSTSTTTHRLYCWVGSPPMVLVEEKSEPAELKVAMSEVHAKFDWVPHYENIEFVIGIAIAGDFIKMQAISRQGVAFETKTFNLAKQEDAIRVLQAAINVGRLCWHVVDECLLHPVRLSFNVVHKTQHRKLLITYEHVEKTYLGMEDAAQNALTEFYKATKHANVQFIERADTHKENGMLKLKLTPVGLERKPSNVNEAKLALKCILTAASGCHKLGWALNDLRWANIIVLQTKYWCVVDCEYARRIGDRIPQLSVRCDWAGRCSAATDLYAIGRLLGDLKGPRQLDSDLEEVQNLLLSKQKCFDAKLTAQQVLDRFEWLQQATPTGSPHGVAKATQGEAVKVCIEKKTPPAHAPSASRAIAATKGKGMKRGRESQEEDQPKRRPTKKGRGAEGAAAVKVKAKSPRSKK